MSGPGVIVNGANLKSVVIDIVNSNLALYGLPQMSTTSTNTGTVITANAMNIIKQKLVDINNNPRRSGTPSDLSSISNTVPGEILSYNKFSTILAKNQELRNKYCACNCNHCTCNCDVCACRCNHCACNCDNCACDCDVCSCNCDRCSDCTDCSCKSNSDGWCCGYCECLSYCSCKAYAPEGTCSGSSIGDDW